jgi:hypothetical protein
MGRIAAVAPDALVKVGKKELIIRHWSGPLLEEYLVRFPLFASNEQAPIPSSIGRALELPASGLRKDLYLREHLKLPGVCF